MISVLSERRLLRLASDFFSECMLSLMSSVTIEVRLRRKKYVYVFLFSIYLVAESTNMKKSSLRTMISGLKSSSKRSLLSKA